MKLFIICLALVGFAGQAYAGGLPSCNVRASEVVASASEVSNGGTVNIEIRKDTISCEHETKSRTGYSVNFLAGSDPGLAWAMADLTAFDEAGNQIYSDRMFVGLINGSVLMRPLLSLETALLVIEINGFNAIAISL